MAEERQNKPSTKKSRRPHLKQITVVWEKVVKRVTERRKAVSVRYKGLPDKVKGDRDGLLSRVQVEYMVNRVDPDMSQEEMVNLLHNADSDRDQMYNINDYLLLMYIKWSEQESVDNIREAFKVFDKDNSGTLSRDEFTFIFEMLGEPLTGEEVDDILKEFDRDGSGDIDFEEFAYVMTGPRGDEIYRDANIPSTSSGHLVKQN